MLVCSVGGSYVHIHMYCGTAVVEREGAAENIARCEGYGVTFRCMRVGSRKRGCAGCMSYRVHYVCVLEALEDAVPVSGRRTETREPARPHVNCGQSLKPTRDSEPRDQDELSAETNKCISKKNLQGAKNGGITLRSKLMQG